MSALGNFTPAAVSVVKAFAYSFRSAPTADLVVWGVNTLNAGSSTAALLDFLFSYPVPQSPFTVYGPTSTNSAFCQALVENFCNGTTVPAATKAAWASALVTMLAPYTHRGDFVVAVMDLVDTYTGTDAELLKLKSALADRAERAAAFAQSPAGAVYDGHGFGQLLAPLTPPATYELSAGATAVDEGASVTFTLHTTNANSPVAYSLQGAGITIGDVMGGQLQGSFTLDTSGTGTVTVTLVNDTTTEGIETLRLALANGLAHADVTVNDTSLTPAQLPTYALAASVTNQNEGSSVTYTLTTTNVAAGTVVPFVLSGNGITTEDVVGKSLTGSFTVNAQGTATATIALAADVTTEGTETLRLRLSTDGTQLDVSINDTSTAPPASTADTVLIADVMNNSRAHLPASAADGEIPLNTYLTYDFLNQSGINDLRLTVAGLKGTGAVAGAPLDPTNFSADRGNLPQLSNPDLFSYDLGAATDRVDYSAETGKIVALVSVEEPAATQYVLVNDNGVDNNFGGETDRMDTLKNVEEVVASAGGGVLDLTNSGQDWLVSFSRGFDPVANVDPSKDRATHRVEVTDLNTGALWRTTFLEYRDASQSGSITQATAAWTSVQGSDRNETLVFSSAQSVDARSNVLRGGTNSVKFNELTRSILVDVSITPWVSSNNPADDTNSTGLVTATTTFTTGDGVTPLSGNSNVTSSHTPDNNVAAGMLKIAASQDAEDAISFLATNLAKIFVLGQNLGGSDGASVRLVGGPAQAALEMTGFETLRDNGSSDDLYIIDNIFKATQGSPRLVEAGGADHDGIRLADEALGSAAVGGSLGAVNLATLSGSSPGFSVDLDVLDLSALTVSGVQASGTTGTDDELVLGPLRTVGSTTGFESLVLTRTSIDKGTALTLDLDSGVLKAGSATLFGYGGSVISAGGLVFGNAGQASYVPAADVGFNITVVDTTIGAGAKVWGGSVADFLVGGAGDDTLRGGGGNDTLDGGVPGITGNFTETWAFAISGTPDATADAAHRITIAMTIDGAAMTLTESAVVDNSYGDGNGAVLDGASTTVIGTAMAALINANLAAINAGPGNGTLTGASYDTTSGTLLLTYLAGVNANDVVTFVLNRGAGPDAGTFALSAGVNVNGGNGGNDSFVFEATAALNGHDTILNFTPASDKLVVSAFAGSAIAAASTALNAATGGTLAGVATTAEFIFNKPQGDLANADFATTTTAGKFVLADGGRCVVAVTADPTGARGDAANTAVSLYYVENGAAAGLSDLSVALVGVISGPVELTLGDIYSALT